MQFRRGLARVFDDNLRTRQWHNIVDYVIIALILISTLQVFLSTYDDIVQRYGHILHIVDMVTTCLFTIEVSLRIWIAPELSPRYRGFVGRLRYCCSFYAIIDILSTYPYYLHFILPVPYAMLKTLRIARLLRVFRYVKAFSVLRRAIMSKKDEMKVSLQFLSIITLILSFVLFFVEHEAQPEVYDNGWTSVVWSFAQYIGDPGGFADTPPITFMGRMVAVVIGVLGIAIFAVPAGLIGSAFSDVMAEDEQSARQHNLCQTLYNAFERKMDRHTGYQVVPRYVTLGEIQARLGMTTEEIITACRLSQDFRLINLASTRPMGSPMSDVLAVEICHRNTEYGCCIDRGSLITIVAPSNVVDPIIGNFAYYLALIGGFNYIAREVGEKLPYRSFYLFDDEKAVEGLQAYMNDLRRLTHREGAWCWAILASSGAQEPDFPEQFHLAYGGSKGDESFEGSDLLVRNISKLRGVYDALEDRLSSYNYAICRQKYHNTNSPRVFARHLSPNVNTCILRVAWAVTAWDSQYIEIAKAIAEVLSEQIAAQPIGEASCLKQKAIAYDGY